jgi:hypothetical protein
MPMPISVLNERTQSGTGMLRYRIEILDARMPMLSKVGFRLYFLILIILYFFAKLIDIGVTF